MSILGAAGQTAGLRGSHSLKLTLSFNLYFIKQRIKTQCLQTLFAHYLVILRSALYCVCNFSRRMLRLTRVVPAGLEPIKNLRVTTGSPAESKPMRQARLTIKQSVENDDDYSALNFQLVVAAIKIKGIWRIFQPRQC